MAGLETLTILNIAPGPIVSKYPENRMEGIEEKSLIVKIVVTADHVPSISK